MNAYRKWFDPNGYQLRRRLDQLRNTFNDLAGRLRSTVAGAIGQAFGNLIQDVVDQTLQGLATISHLHSASPPVPQEPQSYGDHHGSSDDDRDIYGQHALLKNDRDRDQWVDDRFEEGWDDDQRMSHTPPVSSSVSVIVVSAGLQAASLWLRYWSGSRKLLTSFGVGLLTGTLAYAMPALATAMLNLADSAMQLGFVNTVHLTNNPLPCALGLT